MASFVKRDYLWVKKMIGQNIQYLRKKANLSQQALSDILDIPRTTLGDYERENTEPNISLLLRISEYFDTALEPLLTKDLSLERYQIAESDKLKVLAITVDSNNHDNIELVDTKAEAGYLDSYQNPEYIRDLPKIKLPYLDEGTYRGFQISGDSMLPIASGSIIICSYVENLKDLKDGKTYIVISKKEGLVYKRIKANPQEKKLILISDNELYLPYEIAFEDIDELWQYHAHISFDDSKNIEQQMSDSKLSDIHKKVNLIYHQISK